MRVGIIVVLHSRGLAHSRCSKIFAECENVVSTLSDVPESRKCTPVIESLGLQTNQGRSLRLPLRHTAFCGAPALGTASASRAE